MREPLTDAELTELVRDLRFEPGSQAPQRTLRAADALEQVIRERDEARGLMASTQSIAEVDRAVRREALERAARECDAEAAEMSGWPRVAAEGCAARIRALGEQK